ncbi:MarR family transcriptional regulator [Streptomyces sp. NPDC093516]|uniref:MarR family winged helix-turn-helix transcriptional regulator n=1 Tax=Streptomyces sp. NPDC093516 TaxID=3155304 RepID=UPI0034130CC5
MDSEETPTAELAIGLVRSMDRLRSRIRSESGMRAGPWSRSQLVALHRVASGPPATTSDLAAAEYMKPQSMAQTLAVLERHGLVSRAPDPTDGRRVLYSATRRGQDEVEHWLRARETWLTHAIEGTLTDEERAALPRLVTILERLADSDVPGEARR